MSSVNAVAGGYYYGRAYQVALTPPGTKAAVAYGTEGASPSPLRVAFQIARDLTSKTNKSSVTLFNLTLNNRQTLKPDTLVQVRAGYAGLVGTIFIGYCAKVTSERHGADIATTLECGDGEPYITYATIDRSYTQAVTLAQVLQDIADAMQVGLGALPATLQPGVVKGIPNKIYGRGLHLHGACRHALDKLLHPLKIDWSVQNNQLTILPRGAPKVADAQVLSAQTGLVGIPTDNDKYVSFQSLLNPHIVPGGLVQLQSQNRALSKVYKLRSVKYQGDSHGADWVADCEGVALTNPYQVLPAAQGFNFSKAVAR